MLWAIKLLETQKPWEPNLFGCPETGGNVENALKVLLVLAAVVVTLTGCPKDDEDTGNIVTDVDADGYTADNDCDDLDAAIHPDADERCNGLDDDCDGTVDEDMNVPTWYADADTDGYGDTSQASQACQAPTDYVADSTDCDDTDTAINPGATEACNGLDDNCDGVVDEDIDGGIWYVDNDADGYGNATLTSVLCAQPSGYVADNTDCDDSHPDTHPDAAEFCNDLDDDCDGVVDEDAIDVMPVYVDSDGDGYGAGELITACDWLYGYADNADDCDNSNSSVNPTATEYCNGYDDNCDGVVDEDSAVDTMTWYADTDTDGYGDPGSPANACLWPSGYVANPDDCDDTDIAINPSATEACNGYDDDCDGETDEIGATGGATWYADLDSDGYGNSVSGMISACNQPSGYTATFTDCDNSDASVYPGADEYCNGVDDNCDDTVDEDSAVDAVIWYVDGDEDGYGDDTVTITACSAGAEFVLIGGDCDDTDSDFNPGADEYDCTDLNDYNCDGFTGYTDLDGDSFAACEECDDGDANIYPDADEYCNGYDDNCDGEIDEDSAVDVATWFADADGDGFGEASQASQACLAPTGYVADSTDCDDSKAEVNPDASEICNDLDDDCDGVIDIAPLLGDAWFVDTDADGYGAESTVPSFSCFALSGYADNDNDCDDSDALVFPDADEYCNGHDDDCDSVVDEDSAVDATTWYFDGDSDGYGDSSDSIITCYAPSGFISDRHDCDDTDALVFPGAGEYCNGYDDNCDGTVDEDSAVDATTWYIDTDGDGFGEASQASQACLAPTGHTSDSTDCNDSDAAVNPAADEYCDEIDNDCDGTVDEDDALDASTWYADADSDSYGDTTVTSTSCDEPSGYVSVDGDCDDSDPAFHPGAAENSGCVDLNDYNCDGSIGTDDLDSDGYMACTECDDTDAAIYPGATEYCDSVDNDCDSAVDEDSAVDAATWYADTDGDGYGDASQASQACQAPTDYVADSSDCDDFDAAIHPGATETCNDLDDDCDGTVDESLGGSDWYADADGDSFGDPSSSVYDCSRPSGYVADDTDCDDLDDEVFPGADEYCDGIDTDCDGSLDEDDALDTSIWYADADGDGYGNIAVTYEACIAPTGYVVDDSDCDDTSALAYLGATEICGDGVDNDCDGDVDFIEEADLSLGDLVITEINANGTDWFEVWNGSGCDVDLDGIIISSSSLSMAVSADILVADDYAVFGRTVSGFVDFNYDYAILGDLMTADDVIVISSIGTTIDSVYFYNGTRGWPSYSCQCALNLDPGSYDSTLNDDANNWCNSDTEIPSTGDYGTPGTDNETCSP